MKQNNYLLLSSSSILLDKEIEKIIEEKKFEEASNEIDSLLSKTKENIIKYIDNDLQVFITSTDINNIDTKLIEKADVFYVENAKVYERGEKDGRE